VCQKKGRGVNERGSKAQKKTTTKGGKGEKVGKRQSPKTKGGGQRAIREKREEGETPLTIMGLTS